MFVLKLSGIQNNYSFILIDLNICIIKYKILPNKKLNHQKNSKILDISMSLYDLSGFFIDCILISGGCIYVFSESHQRIKLGNDRNSYLILDTKVTYRYLNPLFSYTVFCKSIFLVLHF